MGKTTKGDTGGLEKPSGGSKRVTTKSLPFVTWRQAAKKHFETREKLHQIHTKKYGGEHPLYCMRPALWQPEDTICQAIEMINADIARIRGTDLVTSDRKPTRSELKPQGEEEKV